MSSVPKAIENNHLLELLAPVSRLHEFFLSCLNQLLHFFCLLAQLFLALCILLLFCLLSPEDMLTLFEEKLCVSDPVLRYNSLVRRLTVGIELRREARSNA